MDRPYTKLIAGKRFRFEADGSVTDVTHDLSPQKIAPRVKEPVQETAPEVDASTPKRRRGRPKKTDSSD